MRMVQIVHSSLGVWKNYNEEDGERVMYMSSHTVITWSQRSCSAQNPPTQQQPYLAPKKTPFAQPATR
jgi:hypothetical protein